MQNVSAFTRIGTLYVDDFDDTGGNTLQWPLSAGFEQYRIAAVEQTLHQGDDLALLQHRLAAGDLDEATGAQARDLIQHLVDGHFAAALECVLAVAPRAAQVAPSQAHEDTGQTRMG